MTAEKMAANAGYDRMRREPSWNGYDVWSVWRSSIEGLRVGYPKFIISNSAEMRFATFDEVKQIMQYQADMEESAEDLED